MSTELVNIDQEKKRLIRQTIANNLTDQQFELFISIAKSRGLDPVLNQIHASVHGGKMTTIVGIDGFRLIAHRTGEYLGRTEAEFFYGSSKQNPEKVKLTVFRDVRGQRAEFTATARWSEYYPGDKKGFMWRKMPETMLEKVCEAKALRMAFANDLSGIYAPEEMDQAERSAPRDVNPKPPGPFLNGGQLYEKILGAFARFDVTREMIEDVMETRAEDLTKDQISQLRDIMKAMKQDRMEFFEAVQAIMSPQESTLDELDQALADNIE